MDPISVIQVAFPLIFTLLAGAIFIKVWRGKNSFVQYANGMEDAINTFMRENEIDEMDIVISSRETESHELTNLSIRNKVLIQRMISPTENHMYDFVHMKVKRGYITPEHKHRNTDEFFYVIKGELVFSICCDENGEQRYTSVESQEYILIKHKEIHSIVAKKDTEFVLVALPPLTPR